MSVERDQGLEALQRGEVAAAIEKLEIACRQEPDDYQAHLYLGAAYSRAGRPKEARRALETALHYAPDFAQAKAELATLPPESAIPAPSGSQAHPPSPAPSKTGSPALSKAPSTPGAIGRATTSLSPSPASPPSPAQSTRR